jgi:hypothetical protein
LRVNVPRHVRRVQGAREASGDAGSAGALMDVVTFQRALIAAPAPARQFGMTGTDQ